jgi:DNA-binding response OmpR family regulator
MTPMTSMLPPRPLRILIVEDEALVAFAMEAHLTDAGHEVVGTADTFTDALRLAEETRPDLVLLDIQLAEGSSGLDVAHALHGRGVACLFSTGNCPGLAREDAVGCLHKPYGQRQLLEAVVAADAVVRGERPARVPVEMHLFR